MNMIKDKDISSRISIPVSERVFVTEFSPFLSSHNLLAVGLSSSVLIFTLFFPEDDETLLDVSFKTLREIHHNGRVQCLAFSPETSLFESPKKLIFATGDGNHSVRVFMSDLEEEESVRSFKGHKDYINALVYQPETGQVLASASDDHSVILWNTGNGSKIHTFTFRSPVMSLDWHAAEVSKLMASEKGGVIHIFNVVTYRPILSIDVGSTPLRSSHWSPSNPCLLLAAVNSEWLLYDLTKLSVPIERRSAHSDGTRIVKFSSCSESLIASSGQPNYGVQVFHSHNNHVALSLSECPVGGLSWHSSHNYLAIGHDRKISMYKIPKDY